MVRVVIANAIFLKLLSFSINNYIICGLDGLIRQRRREGEGLRWLEFGLGYEMGLK